MNIDDSLQLASENGYDVVETTDGINGYPRNIESAIIGFETFEEAEKFAKKNGLQLIDMERRDGQQLWNRGQTAYEPFNRSTEEFGDDFGSYDKSDYEDFYENNVKGFIGETNSFEEAQSLLDIFQEVYEEIDDMEDDEMVITQGGHYVETIKKVCMSYSYDTHNYIIAAV